MIVNDIDLTGQLVNKNPESNNIAGYISRFIGVLDGMGCILSGLTAPLFSVIGEKNFMTFVRNIRIFDVNIVQYD